MYKTLLIVPILLLNSCAFIYSGNKERKLQTEIIRLITAKNSDYAKCAKNFKIFKHFDEKRIRIVLYVDINIQGNIEKFKLDDRSYPEEFTNCIFQNVELIKFPKNEEHQLVKIEQAFIFTKKKD